MGWFCFWSFSLVEFLPETMGLKVSSSASRDSASTRRFCNLRSSSCILFCRSSPVIAIAPRNSTSSSLSPSWSGIDSKSGCPDANGGSHSTERWDSFGGCPSPQVPSSPPHSPPPSAGSMWNPSDGSAWESSKGAVLPSVSGSSSQASGAFQGAGVVILWPQLGMDNDYGGLRINTQNWEQVNVEWHECFFWNIRPQDFRRGSTAGWRSRGSGLGKYLKLKICKKKNEENLLLILSGEIGNQIVEKYGIHGFRTMKIEIQLMPSASLSSSLRKNKRTCSAMHQAS